MWGVTRWYNRPSTTAEKEGSKATTKARNRQSRNTSRDDNRSHSNYGMHKQAQAPNNRYLDPALQHRIRHYSPSSPPARYLFPTSFRASLTSLALAFRILVDETSVSNGGWCVSTSASKSSVPSLTPSPAPKPIRTDQDVHDSHHTTTYPRAAKHGRSLRRSTQGTQGQEEAAGGGNRNSQSCPTDSSLAA